MLGIKADNPLMRLILVGLPLFIAYFQARGLPGAQAMLDPTLTNISVAIVALLALLPEALPSNWKNKFLFCPWKNTLPGARCDEVCAPDPRLDRAQLRIQWPQVFGNDVAKTQRNARWYRYIYGPVRNDPSVLKSKHSYLLFRDLTISSAFALILMLFGLGITIVSGSPEKSLLSTALQTQTIFTAIFWVAAYNHGNRLIRTAVAVRSSEVQPPPPEAE